MSRFSTLADWLAWQEKLHPSAIDLSLERLQRTLSRLGSRRPSCPIITVGGTNGKGSCVALTSRILTCAGYRVGTFTSPHLVRYNERIKIDGCEVSDAELIAAFERIDAARADETLTFFEFNALAALMVFDAARPDAIVLEVGMGGRLDAVNVVDADVALVTSIALDHCEWLGPDLESIAAEKAGIFRSKKPAIFGSRLMPRAIADHAEKIGATLLRLGVDFDFEVEAADWTWKSRASSLRIEHLPRSALRGAIQYENAAAVLQVLHCLREPLPVTRSAIELGLRTVELAGRFQVVERKAQWILDVAHNPAAAQALADQLRADAPSGKTIAICGILGDKDVTGIAATLRECIDGWIIASLTGGRAVPAEEIARRLKDNGANIIATAPSVPTACEMAETIAEAGDRVVVFGSFMTVGPAIEWLQLAQTPVD